MKTQKSQADPTREIEVKMRVFSLVENTIAQA